MFASWSLSEPVLEHSPEAVVLLVSKSNRLAVRILTDRTNNNDKVTRINKSPCVTLGETLESAIDPIADLTIPLTRRELARAKAKGSRAVSPNLSLRRPIRTSRAVKVSVRSTFYVSLLNRERNVLKEVNASLITRRISLMLMASS